MEREGSEIRVNGVGGVGGLGGIDFYSIAHLITLVIINIWESKMTQYV